MNDDLIERITRVLNDKKIEFSEIIFMAGDASNRKYFKIKIENNFNVLMYDDNSQSLKNFIKISKFLSEIVTTPKIILNLENQKILVIEYFGENKFNQLLTPSNRRRLYFLATEALISIHKSEKKLNLKDYNKKSFFKESNLFFEWYVDKQEDLKEELRENFNEKFNHYLDLLSSIPRVFIHRDYHVDNLFFLKDKKEHYQCGWIDYQDAVMGPCVYDLVSLTQDARIDVDEKLEKKIKDYYIKNFSQINLESFNLCYKVIAIQRHLKVLGIFRRLALRDAKKQYLIHIPRVKNLLKKNLRNKEFSKISKIIEPLLNIND